MTTRPQEAQEKPSAHVTPQRVPVLPAPSACCGPVQQTSCCEPAAKAECCGGSHAKGCGCR